MAKLIERVLHAIGLRHASQCDPRIGEEGDSWPRVTGDKKRANKSLSCVHV